MSIFDKNIEQKEPQPYIVKEKQLTCDHCGNDHFYVKYPAIFFSGSLMNKHVTCFICSDCTRMHWFDSNE